MFFGQIKPQLVLPDEVLARVTVVPPGASSGREDSARQPYGYWDVAPQEPVVGDPHGAQRRGQQPLNRPGTLAGEVLSWLIRQDRPVVRTDCAANLGERSASQLAVLVRRGRIQSRTYVVPKVGNVTEYLPPGVRWPKLPDGVKLLSKSK